MDKRKRFGTQELNLAEATALQNLYKGIDDLVDTNTSTPCANNDLFVMDYIHADDIGDLCTPCPVFALCETYARTAHPEAGIWAGRRWNKTKETAVMPESESNVQ